MKTLYTVELGLLICDRMATGKSLREVCEAEDIPVSESTVRLWASEDRDGFAAHYARAREAQMEALAEDIIEISDDSGADVILDEHGKFTVQGEVVQRAKLRVDSRKWIMSKIAPKRYGDRLELEHSGSIGNMDDDAIDARIAQLLTAQFSGKAGTGGAPGGTPETA